MHINSVNVYPNDNGHFPLAAKRRTVKTPPPPNERRDIGNPYIVTKMKLNIFYTTSSPTQESMNAKEDKGPGSELSYIWKVEMMRHSIEHLNHKIKISQNGFLHQYIPLKTGLVRHMLAPYSSYSAFVWQACTCSTTSSQKSKSDNEYFKLGDINDYSERILSERVK
jgi:hypothetical protein